MKAIIFDFDGTIADSFSLTCEILHEITHRSQALTAEEVRSLRSQTAPEMMKQLGIKWYQIPYLAYKWRKRMHQRLGEVRPFESIGPILHELQRRGNRLFVLSSNQRVTIEQFLTTHQMRSFFDDIYVSTGVFRKAKALRNVIREQQLNPAACFYVGDEVRDIQAAHKANMPAVAVTWGYNSETALAAAKPLHLVRRPEELLFALQ